MISTKFTTKLDEKSNPHFFETHCTSHNKWSVYIQLKDGWIALTQTKCNIGHIQLCPSRYAQSAKFSHIGDFGGAWRVLGYLFIIKSNVSCSTYEIFKKFISRFIGEYIAITNTVSQCFGWVCALVNFHGISNKNSEPHIQYYKTEITVETFEIIFF